MKVRSSLLKFINMTENSTISRSEMDDVLSIKPGTYEFDILERHMNKMGFFRDNVVEFKK